MASEPHGGSRPARQRRRPAASTPPAPRPRAAGDHMEDYGSTGMACSQVASSCLCYRHLKARLKQAGSY